jgi:hypothetical protein
MWTLWIISTIVEPKYTRYAEFETAMSCQIEQAVVEVIFTQNEIAYCEKNND